MILTTDHSSLRFPICIVFEKCGLKSQLNLESFGSCKTSINVIATFTRLHGQTAVAFICCTLVGALEHVWVHIVCLEYGDFQCFLFSISMA